MNRDLLRMRAELPQRIGLCPQCAAEFYYPFHDGEGLDCPQCSLEMVVYERHPEADMPACTCPIGWGAHVAQDCPRHNPQPSHTLTPTPPNPR